MVLSHLSALSQMLGKESKLKLVFILAYIKLLATVPRKEHWYSRKQSMRRCKAELSTVNCSISYSTRKKPASLFSKPIKCSNIHCFLRCSTNTLSPEENCIITTERGKGKIIFKGAKPRSSSPPPPKGAHKHSKSSQSQANPGDPAKLCD